MPKTSPNSSLKLGPKMPGGNVPSISATLLADLIPDIRDCALRSAIQNVDSQTASRSPSASAKLASPSPIGSTRIIGGERSTTACAEVARAVAVEAAVISAPKLDQGVMTPTVATEPGWTV